ncbi:MAG TPA: hypothetical protein VKB65_04960, partial [Myxococcota bacterium]|nr:hypothetical protein [Myxococcota bacterium]
ESLAEVVGELTQVLLAAIAEAGGDVIPKELLGDLKQGLGALQGRGYELSKGIVTQVEDLGAGLGESLGEDAGELLNDASKKIGSGLNKLLDGK